MSEVQPYTRKNEKVIERWEGDAPDGTLLQFDLVEVHQDDALLGYVFDPYIVSGSVRKGVRLKKSVKPTAIRELVRDMAMAETPHAAGYNADVNFWRRVRV